MTTPSSSSASTAISTPSLTETCATTETEINISHLAFRNPTSRDALPSPVLHFSLIPPKNKQTTETSNNQSASASAPLSSSSSSSISSSTSSSASSSTTPSSSLSPLDLSTFTLSIMLPLFRSFGPLRGLHIPPSKPFGYVYYENATHAAHAYAQLHGKVRKEVGRPLYLHYACVRGGAGAGAGGGRSVGSNGVSVIAGGKDAAPASSSSSSSSSSSASSSSLFRSTPLPGVYLFHDFLSSDANQQLSVFHLQQHKGEATYGEAIAEEDNKFGLPVPKPLPTELEEIKNKFNNATNTQTEKLSESAETDTPTSSSSSSSAPASSFPSSYPLSPLSLLSSLSPLLSFNRVSLHILHPGQLFKPQSLSDRYGAYVGIQMSGGHLPIDFYERTNTADSNSFASSPCSTVIVPDRGLLLISSEARAAYAIGISGRTRDEFVLEEEEEEESEGVKSKKMKKRMMKLKRGRVGMLIWREVRKEEENERRKKKQEQGETTEQDNELTTISSPSTSTQSQSKPSSSPSPSPDPSTDSTLSSLESKKLAAIPLSSTPSNPVLLESTHVHLLYNAIASHFSHTRHSPWPKIEQFVLNIPPHSMVLDVGCGNGKYLGLNPKAYMIGCDISRGLLEICRAKGYCVFEADILALPVGRNYFDYVLSIAVLHHISTQERREKAVRELLRVLKVGGKVLLHAWAQEQDATSRRRFPTQDVLVPWNIPKKFVDQNALKQAGLNSSSDGDSKVVDGSEMEEVVPGVSGSGVMSTTIDGSEIQVFQRYCHVYVEGELEQIFAAVGGNRILQSYYDRGNWAVVAEKTEETKD